MNKTCQDVAVEEHATGSIMCGTGIFVCGAGTVKNSYLVYGLLQKSVQMGYCTCMVQAFLHMMLVSKVAA